LGAAQGIRLADPGDGGGLGTILDKISIPAHLTAAAVWTPIGTEGMIQTMMYGDRYGPSRSDLYSTSLMAAHQGWRDQADSVSETTKMLPMPGTYVNNNFGPRYYGKALNITRRITAAYDKALATFDLLLMPTTPMTGNEMLAVAHG
jgi:amidase